MKFDLNFTESKQSFRPEFGETQNISDGGFERGYAEGYKQGLAHRQYETWTITLTDGTTVEKEVALV